MRDYLSSNNTVVKVRADAIQLIWDEGFIPQVQLKHATELLEFKSSDTCVMTSLERFCLDLWRLFVCLLAGWKKLQEWQQPS